MSLWIAAIVFAALASIAIAWPLVRPRVRAGAREDYELAALKDQLREIDDDLERGAISPAEAENARIELRHHVLDLASRETQGDAVPRKNPLIAAGLALALIGGSFGLYDVLGSPAMEDQPLAARQAEARTASGSHVSREVEAGIKALQQAAEKEPGKLQNWLALAQAYGLVNRHAKAAGAYRKALETSKDNPDLLSAYGEALTLANDNTVGSAALKVFQKVVALDPQEARARYYLAFYEAQEERFEAAMNLWLAMLKDAPQDAPFVSIVKKRITQMAKRLGKDPADVFPRPAPVDIAALEKSLKENAKNYKGWLQLARAYAAAGDKDKARAALKKVTWLYPDAPFVLQEIAKARTALGLTAAPAKGSVASPTKEQVDEISKKSPEEQAELIDTMVANLAEKLKDEPKNLKGWQMLARSYVVIGKTDKAGEALKAAMAVFKDDQAALGAIQQMAKEIGVALE